MSAIESATAPRLLLNRREAAHALGVSERTLFDLTKDGTVPHVKLGERGIRYSVKALEELINKQSTASAQ